MFLKNYPVSNLKKDIPAGIIVALVSIPISMGYAQVAGLPPVYGLYGSVLPILLYGLITSSPRFVFGVDAAPAALCGGVIYQLGIASGSRAAVQMIVVITLMTAGWLFIFRLFHAGKLVKFISSPVMGGFISGICAEIVLIQVPKLYGGTPGRGELLELLHHIIEEAHDFQGLSFALGIGTIAVILICRKFIPKIPMSVVMMGVGALLTLFFHVDQLGVKTLPQVAGGLPTLIIPQLGLVSGHFMKLLLSTLSIAVVIVAETLLATNNYGMRYDDPIDNDREILAYAVAMLCGAAVGSCPTNGSVSRTGIADQFGVKSQMMSVAASATMVVVLMFATGFIAYLPVPVLTGIVISALISSMEFDLASKLRKVDKVEATIFWASFFAVLLLGTVNGVIAGVLLSFLNVIIRESAPPREFLGCIPGQKGFYPCGRMRGARPIQGVLIYHFRAPLFFANAERMQHDIEKAIKPDTKIVILDADGIGSIDVTAAERLLTMYRKLKRMGIHFYMTEHAGSVNDQLRAFGAEEMFHEGAIRPFMQTALQAEGMLPPYPLVTEEDAEKVEVLDDEANQITLHAPGRVIAEYEWAYGQDADEEMTKFAERLVSEFADGQDVDTEWLRQQEQKFFGFNFSNMDEEKLLDLLEMQIALLVRKGGISDERMQRLSDSIARQHAALDERFAEMDPSALRQMAEWRMHRERNFRRKYPQAYQRFMDERAYHRALLEQRHPQLAEQLKEIRERFQKTAVGTTDERPKLPGANVWEDFVKSISSFSSLLKHEEPGRDGQAHGASEGRTYDGSESGSGGSSDGSSAGATPRNDGQEQEGRDQKE